MLTVFTRFLDPPEHSFCLFGPRATGKTTWLRQNFADAVWYDLLKSDVFLPLLRDPSAFRRRVAALLPGSWVVLDEVQRVPPLLHEIHALLSKRGDAVQFALCSSSARKLRRMDVDLLAGRVFERRFFPLTTAELGEPDVETLLRYGSLPKVCAEPQHAVDILEAYVHTYLQQEIQQEAVVRDLGAFDRFLEVAAIMNGQMVNASGIARDSGVARPTVQRYLTVLVDTLLGTWLPAWNPRLKAKEVARPKFYLFDPGVVRAITGLLRDPPEQAARGPLFETLVLNELRAHIAYAGIGGKLQFWRTPAGREVDFIWSRGRRQIGFEVKSNQTWRSAWSRTLTELVEAGALQAAYGIYLGPHEQRDGPVRILPFHTFSQRLHAGELLPGSAVHPR